MGRTDQQQLLQTTLTPWESCFQTSAVVCVD